MKVTRRPTARSVAADGTGEPRWAGTADRQPRNGHGLDRPRTRRPWRILTLGLAVMGVSGLLSSGWLPLSTDAVRQEVSTLLMAVGYPLVGLGAARFACGWFSSAPPASRA